MNKESKAAYDKKYYEENKEALRERKKKYNKKYYEENKEAIAEGHKKYREENKEAIRERKKKYNEKNKEVIRERNKKYYEENKEATAERRKKYREENKEALREWKKKYYKENIEVIRERNKKYHEENREAINERAKKYRKENYDLNSDKFFQFRLNGVKGRAKSGGKEFNLDAEYLRTIYPEDGKCPALGIKFELEKRDNTPSLDRIDNSRGYVKGNVQWVSLKANCIMNNATPEEVMKVAKHFLEVR
jgi:hypothetical protein